MKASARIERLSELIRLGIASDYDEVATSLRNLLPLFYRTDYREGIQEALRWAEVYFGGQSDEYAGGRDQVRSWMLIALDKAARAIKDLED